MTEAKGARPAQPWTRQDAIVFGGLAAVAVVAVALGTAGASRLQPIAGMALILALAYALSSARRAIDHRTVAWGLGLQFLFALIVLKTDAGRAVFQAAGGLITKVLNFTYVGSSFVFGPLGNPDVWPRVMTGVLGAEGNQY
ncbi:MAG TPA: Na+ dependent nucleoside transporter N-terminal domain-containing protein, partial [Vicinamibacterales bacterium]